MKKLLFLSLFAFLFSYTGFSQSLIELEPSQSMLLTGKGKGQDAVINPHSNGNSIAFVENIGDNPFSIRVQMDGEVLHTLEVDPETIEAVKLVKGYELYLDGDLRATAQIRFEALDEE